MIASKSHLWRKMSRALADLAEYADAVAELELHAGDDLYSTTNLPPDVRTVITFRRIARTLPGVQVRGRWLAIPKDTWDRHRAAKRSDTAAPASEARPKAPPIDFAEQFRKAGMRTTKGRAP